MRKLTTLFMLGIILALTISASSAVFQPIDPIGPARVSIAEALDMPDGSWVLIPNAEVAKIRAGTPYFVLQEMKDGVESTIIVLSMPPIEVGLGYFTVVPVEGIMTTLSNGERAIDNCRKYAYRDKLGRINPHGPIPVPWADNFPFNDDNSMQLVSDDSSTESVQSSTVRVMDLPPPGDPPTPSTVPPPIVCDTIANARTAYDNNYDAEEYPQVMVSLDCKGITGLSTSPPSFTMTEPGTDTITVYLASVTGIVATDRINTITATIRKSGTNYWLEVDDGPSWSIDDVPGGVKWAHTNTISWAKTFPDGATLPTDGRTYALEGLVVAERIYIYSETYATVYMTDAAGIQGLVVTCNLDSYTAPGSVHNLNGTMGRKYDSWGNPVADRQLNTGASLVSNESTSVPKFRYTPIKNLFCGDLNKYSKGVYGGKGLNMIDLPVKITGKISYVDEYFGFIYVNDGSNTLDGTTHGYPAVDNVGIRVECPRMDEMTVDDWITVPGYLTSLWDSTNSRCTPLLRSTVTSDANPVVNERIINPPDNLAADSGNAKVYLSWDAAPGAASYTIYRGWQWWDEQLGDWAYDWDPNWTPVVTSEIEYTDATVSNSDWDDYGFYTLYGVTSVSSTGIESQALSGVLATPSADAWDITISSITEDTDHAGYVALVYTITGGLQPAPTGIRLAIDGVDVRDYPIEVDRVIVYDMSEYAAGPHKFELRIGEADENMMYGLVGWDSETFSVTQWVTNLQVSDYVGDYLPCAVKANFGGQTSWAVDYYQGGSVVAQQSGSGTSVDTSWSGSGAGTGAVDVVLTATFTENNVQKVVKKLSATKKDTPDNSNHTNRMWCTNNFLNAIPASASSQWDSARSYSAGQLAQHYDYGNSANLAGATMCNHNIGTGISLRSNLGVSTFQVFNGQNESDIDIWYLASECRTTYMPRKAAAGINTGNTMWGFYDDGSYWQAFGLTLNAPSINSGGLDFVCPLCLLLGNSNHDHTGMHTSWSKLKSSLSAVPTGSNPWVVNPGVPGSPFQPPVTKPNLPFPAYRKFRIVFFAGIGSWRWGDVFGLPITGIYPGKTEIFRGSPTTIGLNPSTSRSTYQDPLILDHCFIGFTERSIISDDGLGNVTKSNKGTPGAIAYFEQVFSKHMKNGHTAWGSVKLAYHDTEVWCASHPGESTAQVVFRGDPFTRMHHGTSLDAVLF